MPRNTSNTPVSRKRSCANCRVAKTRCSLIFPQCARCRSRGLHCEYGPETQEPESIPSVTWIGEAGAYPLEVDKPSSVSTGQEAFQTVFSIRDEQSTILQQTSGNSDSNGQIGRSIDANWNSEGLVLGQGDIRTPADKLSSVLEFAAVEFDEALGTSTFQQNSNSNTRLRYVPNSSATFDSANLEAIMHDNTLLGLQGPGRITSRSQSSLLKPKVSGAVGSFLSTKHLLSVFSSYPHLLCGKISLPPFIHPRYPVNEQDSKGPIDKALTELPDCLAICASLVHMHQFRSPASVKYIWKTIATEQQRLYSEFRGYDKWKLLSALQAITIYLLMQMSDEKYEDEVPFMLVMTMGEISAKLFAENGYYSISELSGNFPDWDDWIFAESLRRTMLLLFIMERLLDINIDVTPPTACTGFDSVPLPCSEKLWKAETRAFWEVAYKDYLTNRKGSGLLKYGTLRQSQHLETSAVDKGCLEDLGNWCTGIDAFGAVVMTVARGI